MLPLRINFNLTNRTGKHFVRDLPITVAEVLDRLASEMTKEEILADIPDLTEEDLKACLVFAANRERELCRVPIANR